MVRDAGLPIRGLYRGEPCEVTLSLALANSGEMQIELIQQHDDTPSIYTEFLSSNGPGYHQLAYWTEDFDDTMTSVPMPAGPSCGRAVKMSEADSPTLSCPTVPGADHRDHGVERPANGMTKFVRDAAESWDGSDPIREIGG